MRALACSLFLVLSACGLDKPIDKAPQPRSEERARADQRREPGRAQWIFERPLKGISSFEHYVISARFLSEEGTILLHSHFNGYEWRDGVQLRLKRHGQNAALELSTPGLLAKAFALPPGFIHVDGAVKFRVEVHDGVTERARVLVWRYNISESAHTESPRPFVSAANADFDSARENWFFQSQGRGALWGVELEGAELTDAYREAPYVH